MERIRLEGRVAIVTGAGHGLGRAHALALAERGAAVVVNDVGGDVDGRGTSDAADAVVSAIVERGGRAVANRESVAVVRGGRSMVEQAMDEFGSVDIVVANAGIQRNDDYDVYGEQDMHDVLDVHLKGSFWVTQAAYRVMKPQRYGRVVFTTSGAGLFGRANSPGYVAAKSGIVGLMNSLAVEGAPWNVLANCIAPLAYTRMTAPIFDADLAERTPPEFVSELVVYLSSEECAVTREVIEAGVGRYARVFVGRSEGWAPGTGRGGGAERIAAHIEDVLDTTRFIVPRVAQDDLADLIDRQSFDVV